MFWCSESCQSKWTIIGKVALILPVDMSKTYCLWFLWIGNLVFHKCIISSGFFPPRMKRIFWVVKYSYKNANLFLFLSVQPTNWKCPTAGFFPLLHVTKCATNTMLTRLTTDLAFTEKVFDFSPGINKKFGANVISETFL